MKKLSIYLMTVGATFYVGNTVTAQNKTASQKSVQTSMSKDEGINLSYMDTSVRPQDDFYNYVNGGWMKTAVIPSDKPSWGSFNALREDVDVASLDILNKVLSEKFTPNSEGEKIQALYSTFIDWSKRNAEGIKPIQSQLAKIDAIKNVQDLQKYLIEATPSGDNPFYGWRVGADMKNSVMNAVYLGGPSLGLGKDYYQKVNDANTKTLAEYKNYVAKLEMVLGNKNPDATAQQIVDFEKKLAQDLLTLEQGRDANLRYNPKTVEELKPLVRNINLSDYLKTVGVNTDKVIIANCNIIKIWIRG